MSRLEVLKSFKNLLKTRKVIFRNDKTVLDASRNQIFEEFRKNKNVKNEQEIKDMVFAANEAAKFLLYGIAQGRKQEGSDDFSVQLSKEQAEGYVDSEIAFKPINQDTMK